MYYGNAAYKAPNRYREIATQSRVEGANPHQLIQILFEELTTAIALAQKAKDVGDRSLRSENEARALSILHALEGSLDFDKGGEIALGLARIYREARRLIISNIQSNDQEALAEARKLISEIASAWQQIG